jgi:putative FmdB family regulatory protein
MPIFEYKCKKCGHITEFLEKSSNPRKHVCEKCKSSDLQKLLSTFAAGRSSSSTSQSNGSCPTGTCPLS